MFEGIEHRVAFHLERRDEEGADPRHDRHNDDDVDENIEDVVPEGEFSFGHGGHRKCLAGDCTEGDMKKQ